MTKKLGIGDERALGAGKKRIKYTLGNKLIYIADYVTCINDFLDILRANLGVGSGGWVLNRGLKIQRYTSRLK